MTKASPFTCLGYDTFFELWPIIDALKAWEKPGLPLYHPQGFTKALDRIDEQIGRLRWCTEVCFAHQAWAKFDFETTNYAVLDRRIKLTQKKLERIAARYKPREVSPQ